MTPSLEAAEREAFEAAEFAAHLDLSLDADTGRYLYHTTARAWDAWLAAKAHSASLDASEDPKDLGDASGPGSVVASLPSIPIAAGKGRRD